VGHNYLGTFFASADALLAPGGVMVMQAITTPENRYEEYIRSTDFINTIIFPGKLVQFFRVLRVVLLLELSKSNIVLLFLDFFVTSHHSRCVCCTFSMMLYLFDDVVRKKSQDFERGLKTGRSGSRLPSRV